MILTNKIQTDVRYHVTPVINLASIMSRGLVPVIGERSAEIGEQVVGVYLFATLIDLEQGVGGWLGEYFEDVDLVALEVDVTGLDVVPTFQDEDSWEHVCSEVIVPERIKVLDLNL